MTSNEQPRLMTVTEAAARLGLSAHTVHGMIDREELPVAVRGTARRVLLNWSLIDARLQTGHELTHRWWERT